MLNVNPATPSPPVVGFAYRFQFHVCLHREQQPLGHVEVPHVPRGDAGPVVADERQAAVDGFFDGVVERSFDAVPLPSSSPRPESVGAGVGAASSPASSSAGSGTHWIWSSAVISTSARVTSRSPARSRTIHSHATNASSASSSSRKSAMLSTSSFLTRSMTVPYP